MEERSVFDELVSELSSAERKELLKKLQSSVVVSEEPLFYEEEAAEIDLDQVYEKLGFFKKLILFFRSVFSGKDRTVLIEEIVLKGIAQKVERAIPGLVDFKHSLFLAGMYEELKTLKEKISVFTEPVEKATGNLRMDFFAFLGKIELEDIHDVLIRETDPVRFSQQYPQMGEYEIRKEIELRFEAILDEIPEKKRGHMYFQAKFLHYLFSLCFFPFERMFSAFLGEADVEPCLLSSLEKPLMELGDILYSMRFPPSAGFIEALFLFYFKERLEGEGTVLEETIQKKMKDACFALDFIRQFNIRIPLRDLLTYISGNLRYEMKVIGGGESWLQLYKIFWKNRIQESVKLFSRDRKLEDMLKQFTALAKAKKSAGLEYYKASYWQRGVRLRFEASMGCVKLFYESVFLTQLNRLLKMLLIDGEFYKPENRAEYTDAYNGIQRIPESIGRLESCLRPDGSVGSAVEQTKAEIIPPQIKTKKIQTILRSADRDAEAVVVKLLEDIHGLEKVLYGILYGEIGGKYDTLSNISYMGGRNNASFIKEMDAVLQTLKSSRDLLGQLYDLEKRWN